MSDHVEQMTVIGGQLRALARVGGLDEPGEEGLAEGLRWLAEHIAFPDWPKIDADASRVAPLHRALVAAWGAELTLAADRHYVREPELVRLSTAWAAVKSFTVAHQATRALSLVSGADPVSTPVDTQNAFRRLWQGTGVPLLSLQFDPDDVEASKPEGMHEVVAWTALRDSWEQQCAAEAHAQGDTTQRRSLFRRSENTTPHVQAATVLSFMRRLRVDAGTRQAAVLIDGPESIDAAEEAVRLLWFLAAAVALACEARLADIVGYAAVRGWMEEFAAEAPPSVPTLLPTRIALLQERADA